jgi:hypothetical protein
MPIRTESSARFSTSWRGRRRTRVRRAWFARESVQPPTASAVAGFRDDDQAIIKREWARVKAGEPTVEVPGLDQAARIQPP